jgi:hypothetical protein
MKDINFYGFVACGFAVLVVIMGFMFNSRTIEIKPTYIPQISEEEKYFNQLTEAIIKCESDGKMVWGDLDKPHKAFGVAQFQKRTFDWLCKLSGKDLDYYSAEDQKELLRWALENWHGRLWTCYSIIKGF